MFPEGFERIISATERTQPDPSDRTATGIGGNKFTFKIVR